MENDFTVDNLFSDSGESSGVVNNLFEGKQSTKRSVPLMDRLLTTAIAGIPSGVAGVPPRDAYKASLQALPILGQAIAPELLPIKYAVPTLANTLIKAGAATGGAVTGRALEQAGNMDFNFDDIKKEGGITFALESAFRIPAGSLLKKARVNSELTEGIGKSFSAVKNKLRKLGASSQEYSIPSKEAVGLIDNAIEGISDKTGVGSSVLRTWKNIFSNSENVGLNKLIEFEDRLSDVAKFSKEGVNIKPPNRAVNSALKEIRAKVSTLVEGFAKKAGIKDYGQVSKIISELKKVQAEPSAGAIRTAITSGGLGGLVGTASQNPTLGFGTSLGGVLLENPKIQSLLFNLLDKPRFGLSAGKIGRLGVTQAIRDEEINR